MYRFLLKTFSTGTVDGKTQRNCENYENTQSRTVSIIWWGNQKQIVAPCNSGNDEYKWGGTKLEAPVVMDLRKWFKMFWNSFLDYIFLMNKTRGEGNYYAELQKKRPQNALSPWQRTGSHLRRCHGQIGRIRLQTAASSTIFSRFGPVRLLFVSKLEKVTRRAEIWVEWEIWVKVGLRHGDLLCRPPENVFFTFSGGVFHVFFEFEKLQHRWVKCIEPKGDCVEK